MSSRYNTTRPPTQRRQKRSSENKKLVFLSKKVLEEVCLKSETTGTQVSIAENINIDCKSHSGNIQIEEYGKSVFIDEDRNLTLKMYNAECMTLSTF